VDFCSNLEQGFGATTTYSEELFSNPIDSLPQGLLPSMKAFLLAGGHGTRLKPLTDGIPKCLLPIRGIPMLQIWFELCRRHGIDEVLINLHSHAEAVRRFIEENKNGLRVHLFEEEILLGSAGTLLANRHWVRKETAFWVFYADVLTTADMNHMLDFHRRRAQIATIGVSEVPDPTRCGIVQLDELGIVRAFVEKPTVPFSHLAFSGLMLATPHLLDDIPEHSPVDLGLHVLPRLVGRMAAYRISDYLLDIGTPENYRAAQLNWPGIVNSRIAQARQC
jgi:mannose-1-phosphate guanylyltransferase